MQFHLNQSEQRQRNYPLLTFFDVTLNIALCSGIFALGCALVGVVLSQSAPQMLAQVSQITTQIFS